MEKNDYIRTDLGEIAIVTDVAKETLQDILGNVEGLNQQIGFCNTEPYVKGNIIKSSKNIIDLIEDGDIVNESLIVYRGKVASGKEKLLIGNHIINGMFLEVANIKSILTHEQYERNCYRLEDN